MLNCRYAQRPIEPNYRDNFDKDLHNISLCVTFALTLYKQHK